jgi:hypothetical protein
MVFTWVDMVAVLVIGLYVWQGYERSVYVVIAEAIAWVSGFYLMWQWQQAVMRSLVLGMGVGAGLAQYLAYLLLFFGVQQLVYRLLRKVSEGLSHQYVGSQGARLLVLIPAALSGLGVVVLLLLAFGGFPVDYPLKSELFSSMIGRVLIRFI